MCGSGPAPGRTVSPVGGEREKQAGEAPGWTSRTSSIRLTPSGSVIRTKEFKNGREKKNQIETETDLICCVGWAPALFANSTHQDGACEQVVNKVAVPTGLCLNSSGRGLLDRPPAGRVEAKETESECL